MIDADALASAYEPPVVVLPRLAWLPLVGGLLSRVLPPKRHVGRVLSYQEFQPFQRAFVKATRLECDRCGAPEPECACPEELREIRSAMTEEESERVFRRFIRAQGLPVRPMLALPFGALYEVLEELFTLQTRANLPRPNRTSGSDSPPGESTRPRTSRRQRTPTPS